MTKDYFLADDLSGALDAAAAFHHAGRRVRIVLSATGWTAPAHDEVVGVTTETRNATAADAAAQVEAAIAHGRTVGARLVYKKIDSTLRGPVAAEVAALARQMPAARLLFTPANPAVGRTVTAGVLRVNGVPVSETEFARDPASPVTESNVRRLLGAAGGDRLIVADAAREEDLAAAVDRMVAAGGEWVGIGSGALARPVAAAHRSVTRPNVEAPRAPLAGPILMLCGSAHPGNRTQAAALARERGVPAQAFRLHDPAAAVAAATASLRTTGAASLIVEEARQDRVLMLQTLANAAGKIVADGGVTRLFATGGETAFALCTVLGISELEFGDEIEAGLCLARAATTRGPLLLAIKPGGFGRDDTWLRAWDRLAQGT